MPVILKNISYSVAGKKLLEQASCSFDDNKRFGLIGKNGAGKTTLFKMILGELSIDDGVLEKTKNLKILTVRQETPSGPQTPFDYLLASDEERTSLLQEIETCEDGDRMGDIYDRLIAIDAYTAEGRAIKVLNGLGFDESMQNRPLDSFSGGYRMRVALGAALFQNPDLLLLDEPTNHLDFEAVTWLKNFLSTYPNTLIIISHDRDLLNSCIHEIVYLNSRKLLRYKGNYDQFEKNFSLQQQAAQAFNAKVDAQKEKWMAFVNRFRAKATKSRQAQSRLKAVEKLTYIENLEKDENHIEFSFPASQDVSDPLMTYDKLFLGYDDHGTEKIILKYLSGSIGSEDRIALLGSNGNGKSTFAKFIAGRLAPLRGDVLKHPKVSVGFFHQHQIEELNMQQTPYQHLVPLRPKDNDTQLRSYLGQFGFSGTHADTLVKNLSGGEKARLVLSIVCASNPHILVLDEPTNHLDISMRESLMRAVNMFPGAVIIISHDWHFLKHTVDQFWVVAQQKITPFAGTLEDYVRLLK